MKSKKVRNSNVFFLSLLVVSIGIILFMAPLRINAQEQVKSKKASKVMDCSQTAKGDQMSGCMLEAPQKPEDISPLLIGESIPMVVLKDASGMDFDLNKAVSEKPTILIFYRGGWCPFCSKQLSGLQDISPELEKAGYQLLAISTDAPEGLMQSESKEHLSYKLLSDANLNVSKQFGLAFKAPKGYWEMLPKTTGGMDKDLLLPVPSVFILDKKGTIQFEYINPDFRQRINPDLLKAAAHSIYKDL